MEEERDELTTEVRELRALNQRLRVELERFQDIRQAAPHFFRVLVRPASRRARRLAIRVARALLRRRRPDYDAAFRPYEARRVRAVAAGRPRVLHAIANFRTGGSARLVVDLIEELGSEYEQRVITQEYPSVRGYRGVTLDELPDLASSRPIRRLLGRFRPDIVHVHYVAYDLRPASDPDYRWYIHVFDAAARSGARVVENVNIPTAPFRTDAVDRYVFVSDYVRKRYARPGDTATVIYPGSDLERFRQPEGRDHPQGTLGLVYRLEPDKLDEASIDPIIDVLRRRADARAMVVGGGQLLPPYQRAAAEAGVDGRVTFTGYVAYDDLPGAYEQMTAFVAPVHTESFGHVSVFAMGMGLPVAGYDVGALDEILGGSELLAPPGDTRALAEILVGLVDDPARAREIGMRNRKRAEELFSVERMIDRYRTLYGELVRSS